MEFESIFILLLIVSFIARAIGEAVKGGKNKGQPPPQPRPRSQQLPQRPGERPLPSGARSEPSGEPQSAADMIPAELWEILTGQPRQAPAPPPAPPRPVPYADEDEELVEPDEESTFTVQPRAEDREVEALMRRRRDELRESRRFDHAPPKVVSLETEPAPVPARHAAFHRKVDTLPKPPTARPKRARVPELHFDQPDELRRAIILQEVLGRPKGLE